MTKSICIALGIDNHSEDTLVLELRKIERKASRVAEHLCNGTRYVTERSLNKAIDRLYCDVQRALTNANGGWGVNTDWLDISLDPRGYQLRVKPGHYHIRYEHLEQDFGGNYLLAA